MIGASTLLFWPVVALTLAGAAGVAFARNLVYAALSLGLALAGVAGLYLFLQAEYLAVVQMIVYVGGVLVLVLFGVMFSRDILGRASRASLGARILGSGVFLVVLASVLRLAQTTIRQGTAVGGLSEIRSPAGEWVGNIASDSPAHLGDLLLGTYLTPFLVAAILLTVVLVAALGLVRKDAS